MSDSGWVWVCPQCVTSYSDQVYHDYNGECKLGHAPRALVRHHGAQPLRRCPACGRRFTEAEYNINDGKCSFDRQIDLEEIKPGASMSPPQVAVETDEGEYDFGFGRSAPAKQPATAPVRSDHGSLNWGPGSQGPVTASVDLHLAGDELLIMARMIRVLADKMGGKVALNPMEAAYVLQGGDDPVPVIEREETPLGGVLYLRIEGGK